MPIFSATQTEGCSDTVFETAIGQSDSKATFTEVSCGFYQIILRKSSEQLVEGSFR